MSTSLYPRSFLTTALCPYDAAMERGIWRCELRLFGSKFIFVMSRATRSALPCSQASNKSCELLATGPRDYEDFSEQMP